MPNLQTMNELREHLAKEAQRVSSGEITAATANATANLCGKILSSVKIELQYHQLAGSSPSIDFIKNNETKKIE